MRRAGSPEETALTRTVHRILLGVVVVLSLALLILWRTDNPRLERLRMGLADALLPSMSFLNQPIEFVSGISRDYRNFFDVYNQNRELRREIQRLRAWRETARQLEEANAQLRALNNVRLAPRTTFVTGDVIADSGGPFRQSALVNVGARDGVRDGSAAVDGNGLIGRVVGVGEHAARILFLTDFSSRVPVTVQPSGRRAILAGNGTPTPRLEFLESTEDITPGDQVRSSGDGGVFPPDLPVGQVIALPDDRWRVALSADYGRLEFVRLLRYTPDTRIDRPGGLILAPVRDGAAPAAPAAPSAPGG
ncbi:MAG TPA: rod shape-determining protein MreC [Thermohalobaculum sp.]|nr:rod shape-determining protein MreC [Thermohalobaculum sp.]